MIGAVVITELALIAEVDDLARFARVEKRRFLFVTIDRFEQTRKRGTERQTATTVVAFLEHAREFRVEVFSIEEFGVTQARVFQGLPLLRNQFETTAVRPEVGVLDLGYTVIKGGNRSTRRGACRSLERLQ
jgi:hypothetical protein